VTRVEFPGIEPQTDPQPVKHRHTVRWVCVGLAAAVVVFLLPTLAAYRYTTAEQRGEFLTHPWRSWVFAWTVITVPGDSRLKTSGAALRKAQVYFRDTPVTVDQVRLLFLPAGQPYTFSQTVGDEEVTTTSVPPYRFVWQVWGEVAALGGEQGLVVALYDYHSGRLLYSVLADLPPGLPAPSPSSSPAGGT
jgi:hypothetical protein